MQRFFKILFYLVSVILIISCSSSKKSSVPRNLEMIYDPFSSSLHPDYSLYNDSDNSSILVGKIYWGELLYNNVADNEKLTSRLKVSYSLYNMDKSERLSDTLTSYFIFEKEPKKEYHTIEIPIKTELENKYILEVITVDQNRRSSHYSFLKIDRSTEKSMQSYFLSDTLSGDLIVNANINSIGDMSISHYKQKFDALNVFYFKKIQQLPSRPYSNDTMNFNLQVDTSWVCYIDSIKGANYTPEGIYYFTTNSEPKNGFVFTQFGEDFPNVKTPQKLAEPLVYLGFNNTISINDSTGRLTKIALDNFWMDRASNIDRARDLIGLYYNRVLNANKYFSSFIEGWRTDRGMVYIIYGLPDYIYKSDEEERWVYSPVDLGPGLSFLFKYYESPFSLNHYVLDREKIKSDGWDSAVRLWKKGEVIYYQK